MDKAFLQQLRKREKDLRTQIRMNTKELKSIETLLEMHTRKPSTLKVVKSSLMPQEKLIIKYLRELGGKGTVRDITSKHIEHNPGANIKKALNSLRNACSKMKSRELIDHRKLTPGEGGRGYMYSLLEKDQQSEE